MPKGPALKARFIPFLSRQRSLPGTSRSVESRFSARFRWGGNLRMSLEPANEFMGPDELVEATPNSLRLRKRIYAATHGTWVEPASAVPSLEIVL